ncbi:MAG TPA: ribosome recycling factor [Candidatus Paceibacterota bacterium]|jgi:ribosome recycling factor
MTYDFKEFRTKIEDTKAWLKKEYVSVRTGRAASTLLDGVQVEAYGARSPISHVAGIGIEDARTLRITPYDMTQAKAIEKAIIDSNLGVSVGSDERGVRVIFPELTSERRVVLQKMVKEKLEEARIAIRRARDLVRDDIQLKEKNKEISEDDRFRFNEEMQKIVDGASKELEEIAERKEHEITA